MKEVISTDKAPKAVGPYSQGIKVGNLLFTAGQIGINPETGKLVTDSIENEVTQIMNNLSAIAKAAGTDLSKVIKTTIFMDDINNYKAINEVYAKFFDTAPPARSAFQVAALPLNAHVEIEMIIEI